MGGDWTSKVAVAATLFPFVVTSTLPSGTLQDSMAEARKKEPEQLDHMALVMSQQKY